MRPIAVFSRRVLAAAAATAVVVFGGRATLGRPPADAMAVAVAAADDARIAAMVAANPSTLAGLLSADLHYAHSNGAVDTKETFLDLIKSGRTKYLAYRPVERSFTFPADGIAVGTGRAAVTVENETGRSEFMLSYLSIWRKEADGWRILAWQSARLPAASAKAAGQPVPQAPAGGEAAEQPRPQ